ncbi:MULTISPECIES: SMC-Scp complex subunit ScpB [unclassified Amycolatopsis]|uniref:SMC-Scp complex subunit ScpB n=1 Tax=unclassified Amycolatopsis TaxID=2618356 RepID=UPI0028752D55|nr:MULTISPECIES: SMC-Scp complex subunit ScpB [unclassified Amycolatopsis]MDS0135567.1 SMC-Scp complex subunit ScpB [Amycolatopsis sp. 505]MDS0148417.1 SMC-Scp complex subunit ScpB [Amycolatopsis sp. CM201R]
MSPENNEQAEAPQPPAAEEPEQAAAELALDEALSGEPVTEDGEPVEPLVAESADEEAPHEEAPHEEAPREEAPHEEAPREEAPREEAPAGESPAEAEAAAEPGEPAPAEAEAAAEPGTASAETEAAAEPDPADPESDLVAAGDADAMPDVTSDEDLEAALEALLLIVDSPASEELLADTLGQPKARIVVALRTMAQKFTDRTSGIDLRRVGEGWRFYTRDVYAPFVEKLLLDGQRSKLTRAALESLAVIAYRQPVTRARVAAVRGVNVDGVIRTLLARGLIEEMGTDPETTGTLYVTTELFLERLGLSSLNDLPPIAPLLPEVDTIDDIQ